ncbi:hypothetical protein LT493_17195 [Streptomyces tricolor]|nr:hypothetical protein [Streptomyces tricolor]
MRGDRVRRRPGHPAAPGQGGGRRGGGCRYVEIAHCGHYGHLEDPGAVNDALTAFFRRPPG